MIKKITRTIIFTLAALYLTTVWNKGFILPQSIELVAKAVLVTSLLYYLIVPLSKLILLPLNLITFGLVSFILYLFILHIMSTTYGLFIIKSWNFQGYEIYGFKIQSVYLNYTANLLLSSISISSIINLLEKLL